MALALAQLQYVNPSLSEPREDLDDGGVVLYTSMGEIEVELYWLHAPRTCANFYELAKRGYYDNTLFHRIVTNFVVQGGDPTGTGRGGESIYGRVSSWQALSICKSRMLQTCSQRWVQSSL